MTQYAANSQPQPSATGGCVVLKEWLFLTPETTQSRTDVNGKRMHMCLHARRFWHSLRGVFAWNWTFTQFFPVFSHSVSVSSRPSCSGLCECEVQQTTKIKKAVGSRGKGCALCSRTVCAWPWFPFPGWATSQIAVPQFSYL